MLNGETYRLTDELQALRETFRFTVYGCRLAIHVGGLGREFPQQSFPEIQGAAYILDQSVQQLNKPEISRPLFESVGKQSTIAALYNLRNHTVRDLPNFETLEPKSPEDKFPLELKREIETLPTAWGGIRRHDDLPRLELMVKTANTLAKGQRLPRFPELLNLGHFGCAMVNVTHELLMDIDAKKYNTL